MTTRGEWAQQCAQLADALRAVAAHIEALPRHAYPYVPSPLEESEWLLDHQLEGLLFEIRTMEPIASGGAE